MNVVIVAKTRMSHDACVGGVVYESGKCVRLMTRHGENQPNSTLYNVGQLWDIDFMPRRDVTPPHTEDVLVRSERYIGKEANLPDYLSRCVDVWEESWQQLFGGMLQLTGSGKGYISRRIGVPDCSTGFWRLSQPLHRQVESDGTRYTLHDDGVTLSIKYVGYAPSIEILPAGTLVRVSLSRWWSPDPQSEKHCYLQLSGWYL